MLRFRNFSVMLRFRDFGVMLRFRDFGIQGLGMAWARSQQFLGFLFHEPCNLVALNPKPNPNLNPKP